MRATPSPPLPTFLIIGAQKSGTRWLRKNLGGHPEVFTAARELDFFSRAEHFGQGLEAYRAGFEGWAGEPVVGESTPAYMIRRHEPGLVAERIERTLPDVRLLAMLRNPLERAYSAFLHHIWRGRIPPDADFLTRATRDPDGDRLDLIAGGLYAASLEPYLARFGPQLEVIVLDDALVTPQVVYDRAAAHIGASLGFRPPRLELVRFSTPVAPSGPYACADGSRRALTAAEREALWPFFERDVGRLEELLGVSLDRWRPSPR